MFRFRLQKVLDHRSRQVDQEAMRLREKMCRHREIGEQREALQTRIDGLTRQAGHERQAGLQMQIWSVQASYLENQRHRLSLLRAHEQSAADEVEIQRERLRQAQRRKEVMEHLSVAQREQWRREQARRERKELDEIGAMRAGVPGKA